MINPEVATALEVAGAAAKGGVGSSFSFNSILSILMGSSMNAMLASIKNVQVIVHLLLLNVTVPANAAIFFGAIAEMVAFDPIDISEYIPQAKAIDPTITVFTVDPKFEALGYESVFFDANLGGLRFILALQILIIVIYIVIAISPCCFTRSKNWVGVKLEAIFFNSLITFIDSTFLVFLVTGMENVKQAMDGDVPYNYSFWMATIALAICAIEFFAISIFLRCYQKRLDEDKPKKRCGYIYEGLNYKIRGGWALLYPILY